MVSVYLFDAGIISHTVTYEPICFRNDPLGLYATVALVGSLVMWYVHISDSKTMRVFIIWKYRLKITGRRVWRLIFHQPSASLVRSLHVVVRRFDMANNCCCRSQGLYVYDTVRRKLVADAIGRYSRGLAACDRRRSSYAQHRLEHPTNSRF